MIALLDIFITLLIISSVAEPFNLKKKCACCLPYDSAEATVRKCIFACRKPDCRLFSLRVDEALGEKAMPTLYIAQHPVLAEIWWETWLLE